MKYQREICKDSYDVIIVGSGISGLVCAVELAYAGLSVLVLEHHFIPGGATTVFSRKQYTFEAGGHRISGIQTPGQALYEAVKKTGKKLNLHAIEPSYVIKMGDRVFQASHNLKTYQDNISALFPNYKREIGRFIEAMLKLTQALQYVSSGNINPLKLLLKHRLFIKYANKTVRQFVSDYIPNEELISCLTILSGFSTLPIEEMSLLTFVGMWGAHHTGEGMSLVDGGTKSLIDGLVEYVDAHNSQVVVSQMADKIVVQKGRAVGVVTKSGREIKAKAVVSAASDEQTYFHLLDSQLLSPAFVEKMKKRRPSGSLFQVYLGIDAKTAQGLDHVTTFVSDSTISPYPKIYQWDLDTITSTGVITVDGPEKAPAGHRSINISCLCPYDHPQGWYIKDGDKTEYKAFKEKLAQRIVSKMSKYIPGLDGRIEVMETASPLTIERYTLASKGAIHGVAHTVAQSGKARGLHETPIPGLYRVGQYVFPGAGIVTAASSGRSGAQKVLHDLASPKIIVPSED